MCTLIIARDLHPTLPVLIAANRDEFFARPATAPEVLHRAPRVVGGRDLQAGGTWMGATAAGFCVALTNQRTARPPVSDGPSRGQVVLEALRRGAVDGVLHLLAGLDPRTVNPFNLLFGDAAALYVAYAHPDTERVRVQPVPAGLHVLPNDVLDSPRFPKVERARALLAEAVAAAERRRDVAAGEALLTAMTAALTDTEAPEPLPTGVDAHLDPALRRALHALKVGTPSYGTRSATVLALRPGGVDRYLFADGPPGDTAFVDHTALLAPDLERA